MWKFQADGYETNYHESDTDMFEEIENDYGGVLVWGPRRRFRCRHGGLYCFRDRSFRWSNAGWLRLTVVSFGSSCIGNEAFSGDRV